jgi:hypothetical protein
MSILTTPDMALYLELISSTICSMFKAKWDNVRMELKLSKMAVPTPAQPKTCPPTASN